MSRAHGCIHTSAFPLEVSIICIPGTREAIDFDKLDSRVRLIRDHVFAASTAKTYRTYLMSYYKFCNDSYIKPVPISQQDLARYVAHLSFRLKYSSIINYLTVVRLLHLEAGFENPLSAYYFSTVQKGVKRLLGDSVSPKLPITPDILLGIRSLLDFNSTFDMAFWAASLVAFFSFFRKSNLLPQSHLTFNPNKQLSKSNICFSPQGVVIQVSWSKTIQYQDRTLQIPLPFIPSSKLCPSTALWLSSKQGSSSNLSPFQYIHQGSHIIMTYPVFCKHLRSCLDRLGFDSQRYSGHSFRRGGATFALETGVPADLVQVQGDWRSDSYKVYIDPSLEGRRAVALSMAKAVQAL